MSKAFDNIINQWQSYLTTISHNLMELSELDSTKIMKVKCKDTTTNGYTGITKVKSIECLKTLDILWQYYSLLSDVVDSVCRLASKNQVLNSTEVEIKELLEGNSIVLQTEHIPITSRGLLSKGDNDKKVTPTELLEFMQNSFVSVRDEINRISQASLIIQTRLNIIKFEIRNLSNTARNFGLLDVPVLNFNSISQIESDPLQGLLELDQMEESIKNYKLTIQSFEQEYNKVKEAISNIKGMISELYNLSIKSKDIIEKSEKMFITQQSFKPIISLDVLNSLQQWLQILVDKLSTGNFNAVKIGVVKLEQECMSKLKIEKSNYELNCALYNEWVDLKGQFKALCEKLKALKNKGLLVENSANELLENIQVALYTIPIDLGSCKQLVRTFELKLSSY